jgi:RHS repeat-associated protein
VYEVNATTGVTTSYYFFGGQRVAMRQGATVYWLHGDHLGSASLTTSGSGQIVSQQRYKPYGQTRWISGTIPTDWRFTDQRSDEAGIGLYDFRARYLDPRIGRFISADALVPEPGDPQSLNRYAYVRNSPIVRVDPDGHCDCGPAWPACFMLGVGARVVEALAADLINTPPITQKHTQPTNSDVTGWTISKIQEAMGSSEMTQIRSDWQSGNAYAAMKGWIGHVRATGAWDYKTVLGDLGTSYFNKDTKTLQFAGREVRFDAIANLTFGYYGASIGIFDEILRAGAGFYQTKDNKVEGWGPLAQVEDRTVMRAHHGRPINMTSVQMYYFDPPYDRWWIDFGMALYRKYNDPRQLTPGVLEDFYVDYALANGAPPKR